MLSTDCSAVISRVTTSAVRPCEDVPTRSVAVTRCPRMSHSWTWTPFVVESLSDGGRLGYRRDDALPSAAWN